MAYLRRQQRLSSHRTPNTRSCQPSNHLTLTTLATKPQCLRHPRDPLPTDSFEKNSKHSTRGLRVWHQGFSRPNRAWFAVQVPVWSCSTRYAPGGLRSVYPQPLFGRRGTPGSFVICEKRRNSISFHCRKRLSSLCCRRSETNNLPLLDRTGRPPTGLKKRCGADRLPSTGSGYILAGTGRWGCSWRREI